MSFALAEVRVKLIDELGVERLLKFGNVRKMRHPRHRIALLHFVQQTKGRLRFRRRSIAW
jgi:hypothetical protein